MDKIQQEADSFAEMQKNSGIMDGSQEDPFTEEEPQKPQEITPVSEEPKTIKKEPEEGDDASAGATKDGGDDGESEKSRSTRPTRVERVIFKQIGEVTQGLKELAAIVANSQKPAEPKAPEQDVVSEKVRDFIKVFSQNHSDFDEGGLTELAEGIVRITSELTAKEKTELPKDVQEAIATSRALKQKEDEREATSAAAQHFQEEWNGYVPVLKKSYPNAGDDELAQARELMDAIAHSEEGGVLVNENQIRGYPLSYLLFQNKDKFDTILKVAAKRRGTEGSSKEMFDVEGDENEDSEDMDMETMNPSKWKRHEARQIRDNAKERQDVKVM